MKTVQKTVRLLPLFVHFFEEQATKKKQSFSEAINDHLSISLAGKEKENEIMARLNQLDERIQLISELLELLTTKGQ